VAPTWLFAYERFDKREDAESALEKAVELDANTSIHHTASSISHCSTTIPTSQIPLRRTQDVFRRREIFGFKSPTTKGTTRLREALEPLLLLPERTGGQRDRIGIGCRSPGGPDKIATRSNRCSRAIAIEPYASSYEISVHHFTARSAASPSSRRRQRGRQA